MQLRKPYRAAWALGLAAGWGLIAAGWVGASPAAPSTLTRPALDRPSVRSSDASVVSSPTVAISVFLPVVFKPGQAGTLPPGPLAVATLGDSLTEGSGDDSVEGGGYPRRLLPLIDALRSGSSLTNFGQSGWNSDALINGEGGTPSQLTHTLALGPAVALVWIGSNDLWYLYEFGDPSPADELQDLQHFTDNIDAILSQLRGADVTVFIALLDDQSLRPVAANPVLRAAAFPGISDGEVISMSQQAVRYNTAIGNKAMQYGAVAVDFYHTTVFTDVATLAGDGNHPNAAGYDAITQVWWAAISPLVQ